MTRLAWPRCSIPRCRSRQPRRRPGARVGFTAVRLELGGKGCEATTVTPRSDDLLDDGCVARPGTIGGGEQGWRRAAVEAGGSGTLHAQPEEREVSAEFVVTGRLDRRQAVVDRLLAWSSVPHSRDHSARAIDNVAPRRHSRSDVARKRAISRCSKALFEAFTSMSHHPARAWA